MFRRPLRRRRARASKAKATRREGVAWRVEYIGEGGRIVLMKSASRYRWRRRRIAGTRSASCFPRWRRGSARQTNASSPTAANAAKMRRKRISLGCSSPTAPPRDRKHRTRTARSFRRRNGCRPFAGRPLFRPRLPRPRGRWLGERCPRRRRRVTNLSARSLGSPFLRAFSRVALERADNSRNRPVAA